MAKSDSTTFKSIVQAIPAIAGAYREGLQALESKDAGKVKPQNPRKLSGSVYLDKCLETTNHHDARWDYVIGYSEKAYFVEVHPANTSNAAPSASSILHRVPAVPSISIPASFEQSASSKHPASCVLAVYPAQKNCSSAAGVDL